MNHTEIKIFNCILTCLILSNLCFERKEIREVDKDDIGYGFVSIIDEGVRKRIKKKKGKVEKAKGSKYISQKEEPARNLL